MENNTVGKNEPLDFVRNYKNTLLKSEMAE
jgi:hypothetical protein